MRTTKLNNKSIEDLNKRADVLEKEVAAIAANRRKEEEREREAEIEARFASMREERVKTMGPDGWKYYTPEEEAFYLQRELKASPESRYEVFKSAPYWHTPEHVNHARNGVCSPECAFSEPNGRIEDDDVIAYYSIPPGQRPGPFEFFGQRLLIKKNIRENKPSLYIFSYSILVQILSFSFNYPS